MKSEQIAAAIRERALELAVKTANAETSTDELVKRASAFAKFLTFVAQPELWGRQRAEGLPESERTY
jgi:hypothetical protein